jgi:hypothetical protein
MPQFRSLWQLSLEAATKRSTHVYMCRGTALAVDRNSLAMGCLTVWHVAVRVMGMLLSGYSGLRSDGVRKSMQAERNRNVQHNCLSFNHCRRFTRSDRHHAVRCD